MSVLRLKIGLNPLSPKTSPDTYQKLLQDLLRSESVKLERIADQPLTIREIK